MKTHTGRELTTQELQQARDYVASNHRSISNAIYKKDDYADHVTENQKIDFLQKGLVYAIEIELGQHDDNFTVWQKMNTFITGKCVALFPND